uniref:Uncharacterized protein n=1 Tax=Opuntia streptacantha TaxID=393608 RepID=A0A7C8YV74_OPUST
MSFKLSNTETNTSRSTKKNKSTYNQTVQRFRSQSLRLIELAAMARIRTRKPVSLLFQHYANEFHTENEIEGRKKSNLEPFLTSYPFPYLGIPTSMKIHQPNRPPTPQKKPLYSISRKWL